MRSCMDMATMDPLTGTYMRGFATQQLEHAIKRCIRRCDPISLMMVDLDRFKEVNDAYGHQVGDRALAAVGQILRELVRDTDTVGRFGGDEFMVILPETPADGARIVAERLLQRVAEIGIEASGAQVSIRLSVGIGTLMRDDDGQEIHVNREQLALAADSLVGSADRGLYRAKGSGQPGMSEAVNWGEFFLATTAI